jgi:hypothetical protein
MPVIFRQANAEWRPRQGGFPIVVERGTCSFSFFVYSEEGIEDPPSRDKLLAQGKSNRGNPKGKPAGRRRKAGARSKSK